MYKRLFLSCAVLLAAVLASCAPQLAERHADGAAIVVYPDDGRAGIWRLVGGDYGLAENSRNIGGGYRAAALQPGRYALVGLRQAWPRSAYGQGHKDLDYGERLRSKNADAPPLAQAGRLPLALVDRPAIKEERTRGNFWRDYVLDVSSEYRALLDFEAEEPLAWFELRPGEVVLLPLLRAEISLDERSCARRAESASPYNSYTEPYLGYPLSHDPEDFTTLKWLCPVRRLVLLKAAPSLEAAQAGLDKDKLAPELLLRLEQRDLNLGPLFLRAQSRAGEGGGAVFIFDGP